MFFLPPIVGFFFTYFLINWIDDFFETKFSHSLWFPILVLFFSLLAEYIALFWNYNFYSFATRNNPMTITLEFFVDSFKSSAFLPFILSCILGWLSHIIIEQTQESK
jgi:UDP-N-acetylmuramyl pentapeptide phosphotransferase/UDP-N-acetylglucosamine-1-phosphate transferase